MNRGASQCAPKQNKEETTMERKIGQIFQHNKKWYQCVEGDGCKQCAFYDEEYSCCDTLSPDYYCCDRSDGKDVIFKELEKVGEPYEYYIQGIGIITVQEYNLANSNYIWDYNQGIVIVNCPNERVAIELKQTKEDMEEQGQCGDNRFEIIAKAKEALLEETNIARDKQEMAVIDNILFRCWQMGWLDKYDDTKHSNSESIGKNLKPFDLEAAKVGKPVCTRDGRKARIICFDAKGYRPIVALIEVDCEDDCTPEDVFLFTDKGYYNCSSIASDYDLMMLPVKKEGWVNVYKHFAYRTKEEAQSNINPDNELIDTIKIEWEEYS